MKLDPQLRMLKAIKPHKYGTRHLVAGDEYEVPPRHAIALVAARKAKFVDKGEPEKSALVELMEELEPTTITGQIGSDKFEITIDSLRLQATQLGINVDGRWGIARLQHEIDQAKR